MGVLYSADGGTTWQFIDSYGLANVPVLAFSWANGTNTLYAFTHGRGVFYVQPDSAGKSTNLYGFILACE